MSKWLQRVSKGVAATAVGALALAWSPTASAEIFFSFGFTDLSGTYNSATQDFRAVASANGQGFNTGGDVTRQVDPTGTATFETGFMGGNTSANFELDMRLSNITGTTADVEFGNGNFEITDVNGNRIFGGIFGQWFSGPNGFLFFNGALHDVQLEGDVFTGTEGSFDMEFPVSPPYPGAVQTLSVNFNRDFFASSFGPASTMVQGQVIPAPAALALLGLAGLATGRRRRAA